ncbi:MAG TPA: hypothetical protein VJJ52_04180 [Candidatus Nanoarchaeia archaeon]|nr:hypothetical protein [Candidatus Nanoarchaeia archaeon]
MRDIGVVTNSALKPLSSERWTQSREDVYSILAGPYIVSIHKPKGCMQFGMEPTGNNRTWSIFDVDASLLIKQIEPPPAFLPRPPEPHYLHVLDAQFHNERFLFGTEYHPPYSGQRRTNVIDIRNYITVEIGQHPLILFGKTGLPEDYRNAVFAIL